MKKIIFLLLLLSLTSFLLPKSVEARSGCCSHHGGVCGCGCCDGTSLSTTCAPYYPECSRPTYMAPVATKKPATIAPRITASPTYIPTEQPTIAPAVKSAFTEATTTPQVINNPDSNSKQNSLGNIITILSIGGLAFMGIKYKNLKNKLNEN